MVLNYKLNCFYSKHSKFIIFSLKNKTGTDEESVIMNAFKLFDGDAKGSIHRDM